MDPNRNTAQNKRRWRNRPHIYLVSQSRFCFGVWRHYLDHGDAKSPHGSDGTAVLQLTCGLRVQLNLMLRMVLVLMMMRMGGRDAQEVLGELAHVHLRAN